MQNTREWALAMTSTGTLTGALGRRTSAEAQARIAEMNARVEGAGARVAIARGDWEREQIARRAARILGRQRASLAGQNVDLSHGSALQVQLDTQRDAELDMLTAENNARLEAWGHRTRASGYRYESRVARQGGRLGSLGLLAKGSDQFLEQLTEE